MNKKISVVLLALCLLMMSAAAMADDIQVDRLCPTCGTTTTGTVVEIKSWDTWQHQFTFKCGTCGFTSECDEAHYGGGANCSRTGKCSLCGNYYYDWNNHNWSAWKPTEDGKQHYRTCSNDYYNPCTEYADHTVSDPQKLCTELQPCTVCHADFYSDNHDWGDCKPTEDGKQHYYICTRDSSHTMLADHASSPQATCVIEQTCATCKASYTDPTNHQDTTYIRYEASQPHSHLVVTACSDCDGTVSYYEENHPSDYFLTEYEDTDANTHTINYLCRICHYLVPKHPTSEQHTFSEATCVEAPTCVCGRIGGSTDPDSHAFSAWTMLNNEQHTRTCEREGCGKTETDYHTGGTATATRQAECEVCHSPYGDLLPVITSPAQNTTVTVLAGEQAKMTITAQNAAHYKWQMSTDSGAAWANCGTDSPTCTTAPAVPADDGTLYRCTVISSDNLTQLTADSPAFTLRVLQRAAVTLNTNGGTIGSGNVAYYIHGEGATLPTDVQKENYKFAGWYANKALTGDPVTAIGATETGAKEYWAKWTADDFSVTLNVSGGTIKSGNVTGYPYGTGATLPTDVTRTGYTFAGWYANEALTGSPVTAIGATETGAKEYWAKWVVVLTDPDGEIVSGDAAFAKLPPVTVPTLVLPEGTPLGGSVMLKYVEVDTTRENTAVYDVYLVDQDGNRMKLPAACTLCLPYPEGLNQSSASAYRIHILHEMDGGRSEDFDSVSGGLELTPQGLCVRISSLSPFTITWERFPEVNLPQTGDSSHPGLWLALGLASIAALAALALRGRKNGKA